MLRNYFTLKLLFKEFAILKSSKLIECYSQEKNEIIFHFFNGNNSHFLCFSTDNNLGTIYMRDSFNRSRKNSVDLFPELIGLTLKDLFLDEHDRIITFDFEKFKLIFLLFGSSKSNAVLRDSEMKIINSFKKFPEIAGKYFKDITQSKITNSVNEKNLPLIEALNYLYPKLGKNYLREIFFRTGFHPDIIYSEFNEENLINLTKSIEVFIQKLEKADEYYILKNSTHKLILSLTTLNEYPEVIKTVGNINEAVRYYISYKIKTSNFSSLYEKLSKKANQQKNRIENKLVSLENEDEPINRAEKYFLFGSLLSSQENIKQKGLDNITVLSLTGEPVKIPLKSELTLLENSYRYFEKSKSIKRSLETNRKMISSFENKLEKINSVLIRLKQAETVKELDKIMKENTDIFMEQSDESPTSKFRKFILEEGYVLYVGKNAANNDELTMKFAKPNDIWLHARGTSGSHAVLRMDKNDRPPKNILQKAAAITAYYSGSKNSKYTPVAYTYKKYVHKPKGSDPGSVVISREEVIMVEPKLPVSDY